MADELEVTFDIGEDVDFDCEFSIDATTFDYTALDNKPQINNVTLEGNKTSEELHLASAEDLAGLSSALDFEIQARETADTNINSAIAIEIANRQNADIEITNNISELDAKVDGINVNLTQQINAKQPIGDYATNSRVDGVVSAFDDDIESLDNKKVDKVTGKSLILDTEIERLTTLHNYDDTSVKADITNLSTNKADKSQLDDYMSITTKYGASISLSIDDKTFVITAQLKDKDGNNLGNAQKIDLPLESVVVSGSYNKDTKEVVLTLKDGSTVKFSVADLVSGLQSEITDLDTIRSNAQAGKDASDTITTYGDIVTHNINEFQLAGDYATNTRVNEVENKIPSLEGYATETYVQGYHDATKQDELTAGTGIKIENNVISNTQTSAEWGNIQGELSNQTDLQTALAGKTRVIIRSW